MKGFALVASVALALVASGCGNKPQTLGEVKVGGGSVPKTRFIVAAFE
jgi:hypothetical protein